MLNHYYEIKKNLYFNQKITIGNYIQNFEEKQILNYYFDGFHSYKLNNLFNLNFNLRYGKVHINNEISIPDGEKNIDLGEQKHLEVMKNSFLFLMNF